MGGACGVSGWVLESELLALVLSDLGGSGRAGSATSAPITEVPSLWGRRRYIAPRGEAGAHRRTVRAGTVGR